MAWLRCRERQLDAVIIWPCVLAVAEVGSSSFDDLDEPPAPSGAFGPNLWRTYVVMSVGNKLDRHFSPFQRAGLVAPVPMKERLRLPTVLDYDLWVEVVSTERLASSRKSIVLSNFSLAEVRRVIDDRVSSIDVARWDVVAEHLLEMFDGYAND